MRNNPAIVGRSNGRKFPSVKARSGGTRNVPASNRAQSESVRRRQFSSSRLGLTLMPIDNISISTTHDTKYFMFLVLNCETKFDRAQLSRSRFYERFHQLQQAWACGPAQSVGFWSNRSKSVWVG